MRHRHRVLGFLTLLFAITYIDRVCISVAGPRMQEELGIDPVGWGWVTAMFTLSYALFEIPTGAMGVGDDIGAAVAYLASKEAGYVTGQTLHVNGGMAMP